MFEEFEFVEIEIDPNLARDYIFFQEGDYSAAVEGMDVCEVNGQRSEQQDTLFLATLNRSIKKPLNFFRDRITSIAQKHQNCLAGTTVCGVIVTPPTAEQVQEGKTFPKLFVTSLGDSPAAIVLRLRNGENVRHLSLALTENHALDVERIKNHVEANGGTIAADAEGELRVMDCNSIPSLNMGAAIGDCGLKSNTEGVSPLKIEPDILGYDVNKLISVFALPGETVEAADLILSCDGLYDLYPSDKSGKRKYTSLAVDQQVKITTVEGKGKLEFQAVEVPNGAPHLSQLAQNFYDQGGTGNFAEELVRAALKFNSNDNISVIRISLMKVTQDLIAGVFDGHGVGVPEVEFNPNAPNFADGKMVSASVASDLFVAARAVPIAELNAQTPQGIFHQMVESKRNAINSAKVTPTKQVEQNDSTTNGTQSKLTINTTLSEEVPTNVVQTPTSLDSLPNLSNFSPNPSTSSRDFEKLQNSELVQDL